MYLCYLYKTENHAAMVLIQIKSVHVFKAALFTLTDQFETTLDKKKIMLIIIVQKSAEGEKFMVQPQR